MPWLGSATVVVIVRFFHAAGVGYDLGLQIEAAQNLLLANGLTVYEHFAASLNEPAQLMTLTHFPAGYSVLTSALLTVGFGVGTTVKILAATATVLGWWGWARLGCSFADDGSSAPSWRQSAWVVIAILTPLMFTPKWDGTDIFLWAAVPWAVESLVAASGESRSQTTLLDGLTGALCGVAFLIRYAALFLAVYAIINIVRQCRLRVWPMLRRLSAFGLGFAPLFSLQLFVIQFVANSTVTPGGLSFHVTPGKAMGRLWDGIQLLHTADYLWAFWAPGFLMRGLFPEGPTGLRWQLGFTMVCFGVLLSAVWPRRLDAATAQRERRMIACWLFAMIPCTLMGSMLLGPYDYVGDARYYLPGVPLSVFVAFSLVGQAPPPYKRIMTLRRILCSTYIASYMAAALFYAGCVLLPGERGSIERGRLIGTEVHSWPSMAVSDELSPARQLVMHLLKQEPQTLLLTSRAAPFFWDENVDRSRLYDLDCGALAAAYVRGPARMVIMTFDVGEPQDLWFFIGNGEHGSIHRSDCFGRLPHRTLVQRFPQERLKVLEARIDTQERIVLKSDEAPKR
jgi:hypothetical protein